MNDILVGRDDGTVEVYGFDSTSEPTLRFEHVSLYIAHLIKYGEFTHFNFYLSSLKCGSNAEKLYNVEKLCPLRLLNIF